MRVFTDTSGIFALMASNDLNHQEAKKCFDYFSRMDTQLVTSSFILVETTALLQKRTGMESVYDFHSKIFPLLDTVWVNNDLYNKAVQRLLIRGKKEISLVDCISFEIMESNEIKTAFSFEKHFEEMGFNLARG
jgi:predicted nucleic acid-binding protein